MTAVTPQGIHACGEDGLLAVQTGPLKEQAMDGTGNEVFDFPREAIIGHRFLETTRADVGGLRGEARELIRLRWQCGTIDGRVVWGCERSWWSWWVCFFAKLREAEEMARESLEWVESHGVELIL